MRHVWIDNVVCIFAFVPLLGRSVVCALDELGSARWRRAVRRFGQQAVKSVTRGAITVLLLAIGLWIAARRVGLGTGALGRPVIERFVLVVAVRDALPLVVALFLAVRQGAALTTKFAFPESGGVNTASYTSGLLAIAPYVTSGMIAGGAFFAALAVALLGGYLAEGPLANVAGVTTLDQFITGALRASFLVGLAKTVLFGAIVVHVALALGWRAGHAGHDLVRMRDYAHYHVWEAATLSLGACVLITLTSAQLFEAPLP